MGGNIQDMEMKSELDAIIREKALHKFKKNLKKLQENVIQEMDNKMNGLVDSLLNEVQQLGGQNGNIRQAHPEQNGIAPNHENANGNKKILPERQFVPCNSLLTDLLEVQHIRTIYHVFAVMLLILFLNTLIHDYLVDGSVNIGLNLIKTGFAKIGTAVIIWGALQLSTFALYYAFKMWATTRHFLSKNHELKKLCDLSFLMAFILYQISFMVISMQQVLYYHMGMACAIAVLMETVRFLMKAHAFVRSNAPRVLAGKLKSDDANTMATLPSFSTYLYYLFAPTTIYRDYYPRTKEIRWNRIAWNLIEIIGTIFYVSFILERFFMHYYGDFGKVPMDLKTLVLCIFSCVLPGTISGLCAFYCLLHSWMNAMAELLRFADRTFYRDWWNTPSFSNFYRTWNIVVHDWLYTYIYKDMYEIVFKGSKVWSSLVTFFVSAIFHEIILAGMFRYFYPVLLVMFLGVGLALSFIPNRNHKSLGNIFFWFSFSLGNGVLVSLLSIEYFARQNCKTDDHSIGHYFVPVSWYCNGQ